MQMLKLLFIGVALSFNTVYADTVEIISGNNQMGIVGEKTNEKLIVRMISDQKLPLKNVPVIFNIVQQPGQPYGKGKNAALSARRVSTDKDGVASAEITFGYPKPGSYVITAASEKTAAKTVVFELTSQKKNWMLMLILGLLGGLGVFLFGMFYLNDSLQKVAGKKLRSLLITLTGNPMKGLFTGLSVTMLNQSSSATTVLEVSLVSAGLLTFYQSMAVTVGAAIGSTVTAQLVAFKLSDFAALIAGLGFFITFFSSDKKVKNIGSTILGFGVLFIGMKIMSDVLSPLKHYQPFMDVMEKVENPAIGILVGLLFTLVVQSSGATAGIVIALAMAGALTLKQAIPINLGASVGTCITAILGAIGRGREGKRVAIFHSLHQMAGVILVYPFLAIVSYKGVPSWIFFTKWITRTFLGTDDLARQIAMAHTMVSIFNAIWILPLIKPVYKLMVWLLPSKEEEKPFGPIYLDDSLLATPDIALIQARKEIVREGEFVKEMLHDTINVFDCRELKFCDTLSLKDVKVDMLHNAIVPYLTKIGQMDLTPEQAKEQVSLLYLTADIEAIGDVIDKNMMPLARKKFENKLWFSNEGWSDIVELHKRVLEVFEKSVAAIKDKNKEFAQLVANSKPEIGGFEADLRKKHIARLNSGLQESLETSSIHIDLIDQFKRINSHAAAIGYVIMEQI